MRRTLQHPARLVPIAFLAVITIGTALLMLPAARAGGDPAPATTALFTATSAACVTGLVVVDTPTYWSGFGQAVILLLLQVGGFGIMALATLLGLLVSRRLGLRTQLVAQAETRTLALGDVRAVLVRIAATMLVCEALAAAALTLRFWLGYDYGFGTGLWHGIFHGVSAFNNAGFALYPDSLIRFVDDWWISLTVALAVLVGALGFPVLFELRRQLPRPSQWSAHTRLTVGGTALLIAAGFAAVLAFEWDNPHTLGPYGVPDKAIATLFQAVVPRTAGMQTIDYGAASSETIVVTYALMFIGGGSASTAGGIKVVTFFLLAYVLWAEVRGETDVVVGHRRINQGAQRQALAVALLGVAVAFAGTLSFTLLTDGFRLSEALFEVISAASTNGLSMNLTPRLPEQAQLLLVILMFMGRVGPITVASALALTNRPRRYRYPEERPIVG